MQVGETGYATISGTVGGIDTSLFTMGDYLYLDEENPGKFTTNAPTGGSYAVVICTIIKVHATEGEINVDITKSLRTVEVDNQMVFQKHIKVI